MTQQQKENLLAIIAEDCLCQFEYENDKGETCVIGQMLRRANLEIPKSRPTSLTLSGKTSALIIACPIAGVLAKHYGLDTRDLLEMQYLNDQSESVEERRVDLTRYVNSLSVV
jgi:hypothetical protein